MQLRRRTREPVARVMPGIPFLVTGARPTRMATIKIDPKRKLGHVDRKIYGNFIEHLGRCIYGGVFEEGSPLSDERGFRQDVLEAARGLRIPILRWPGGNFVSGYHWTDGVGPPGQRPRRIELAWRGEEPNRFGTDEFITYCRALGTEPYICVNMGSGTMDEAQAWVEYCNGTGNTSWANLRRANGHPEPYNVKYWGLGNEMYGAWQIGASSAEDYVKKARQFAAIMKWTDPSIELVGCGQWGWTDWDKTVIDGLAPYVRYHSVHLYTGSGDYWRNVLQPHQADRAIRICETLIERARYEQKVEHPIGIAFDEWNVWYRTRDQALRRAGLEEQYDLSDALAVATYLNIFIRHCRSVEIANFAQMVNAIAPIFTNREGLFLQTIYHPLRLYAEHAQEVALDPFVDSPTCDLSPGHEARETSPYDRSWKVADLGPFALLDVTATCDESGRELCVAVVNRSPDQPLRTTIELDGRSLAGELTAYEVNGPDPGIRNSFEQPETVRVQSRRVPATSAGIEYTFAPHSVTLLRGQIG
jgi:alpha-L-arabinofuranosidase